MGLRNKLGLIPFVVGYIAFLSCSLVSFRASALQFENTASVYYEVLEGDEITVGCLTNQPAYYTALEFHHPPVSSFFVAPNGQTITQEGQIFVLRNVTQRNSGNYSCMVKDKNLRNTEIQVATVIVKSPLPQPQQGSQPEEDETPQGETAAIKLTKSKPYVYFKQKSPVSKYLSDTKPLDLSFKAKGLQPIKIKWKKDNLELFIGSRYKTFDSGRQLLVQPPFTKLDTGTYGVSACNFKGCSVKGVQVLFRENHTHDQHVLYGSNEGQKEPLTVKDFVKKYGFLGIPSVLVIILIIAIACATGGSRR